MSSSSSPTPSRGPSGLNPVVVVLLSAILVALGILIGLLLTGRPIPEDTGGTGGKNMRVDPKPKPAAVKEGETAKRDDQPTPPAPPPKPVAKPDRIKETLRAGKSYRIVLKEGLQSRVEDSDWGLKVVVNITYAGEHEILRKIESNDGHRIVELRQFVKSRNVKVLSEVEQAQLDLGVSGTMLLFALEYMVPGTAESIAVAKPVFDELFKAGAQQLLNDANTKVIATVDSLAGKQIRIVYVDGVGVESVTPIGCFLTADERDFVFDTAILSDCYIFPEIDKKQGESWSVDGSQFTFLFDPSWRGRPVGNVTLVRDTNQDVNGQPHAVLKVGSGVVTLNATDQTTKRLGTFTPTGQMTYALTDGYIDTAKMQGKLTIEQISQDHLLFPSVFKAAPTITIDYSCQIQP